MITCPCNVDPLTPHFYIVKLGFTGIYFCFLFFALKHRLWVLVRTALLKRFKRVPPIYDMSKTMEVVKTFQLKIDIFTAVKNRCMLHRHVIVMDFCIRLKWASSGFRPTGLLRYTG